MKKPEQMSISDYRSLGFRCGLEIHQQLDTRTKLFCRCPATTYSPRYDAEILRHMRPTLSELGEYDPTALMEFKTKKNILYRIARDTVCTYEMDDTPPFMINEEALDIAIEVAILLGLKLVSELHIARKQYLDGSIPTGFQRTTLVGVDGAIPFRGRILGIRQLGLEEDSCREVSDVGHLRTYMTDRLSIPLIETVTEPELLFPEEAVEAGQILRCLVRSTGKVRTGMGAARQDVNVSITGGTRVEIKGVPRIPMILPLTHYEALRQRALLDMRDELRRRGLKAETFQGSFRDVTGLVKRTHVAPIRSAVDGGGRVAAIRLPGFAGVLNKETGPEVTLAREFSGRVRVIACLDGEPNLVFSDAPEPTLSSRLWERISRELQAGGEDVVVLVWGAAEDVETASREVIIRAREVLEGIPSETRKALKDGTTEFERLLPGPDRMYPDTDLPPKAIEPERIEGIGRRVKPRPWERVARYEALGVPGTMAMSMVLDPRRELFEHLLEEPESEPLLAFRMVGQTLRSLRRRGRPVDRIPDEHVMSLFRLYRKNRVTRDAMNAVLWEMSETPESAPEVVLDRLLPPGPTPRDWKERVREILADPTWHRSDPGKAHRLCMGLVMKDLRGRVPGKEVAEVVRQLTSGGQKP